MDIIQGDCLEQLKKLESNSIDGCVTDPPAGISFMNKEWDHDKGGRDQWMKWMTDVFTEVLRVLKPGGHCLVWAIPRTSHWTAMSIEDAGFEVRDCVYHIFGQGFPKSHNVGMGIDKKMKLIDHQAWAFNHAGKEGSQVYDKKQNYELNSSNGYFYKGKSEEAKKYDGYGSQLKPAVECWWLIRKPFKGSIVDNVLEYGTGGLNIDKSRIELKDGDKKGDFNHIKDGYGNGQYANSKKDGSNTIKDKVEGFAPVTNNNIGRFPANLIHDGSDEVMKEFEKYGNRKSSIFPAGRKSSIFPAGTIKFETMTSQDGRKTPNTKTIGYEGGYDDEGSVARFFYCSKTSTAERNIGIEKNGHPTVKPVKLMSYLINLIMPPEGVVLDPFMGSGSTGIAALLNGYDFVGIEQDSSYIDIAKARMEKYEEYRRFLK